MAAFILNVENSTSDPDAQELSVVGYSCKLFKDDQKAIEVNDGTYLVPWFSDKSNMMDRFDGRGHLMDLSIYDSNIISVPSPADTDSSSAHEKAMEQACDEERYRDLQIDPDETSILEEEEKRRAMELVRTGYGAVQFSYNSADVKDNGADVNAQAEKNKNEAEQKKEEDEDDEPYEIPPGLYVPPDYVLPLTMKQGAIIDRTSGFIANQGTQMEIVVKTKQSGNPQFAFLHYDHQLNPYYKHVVAMIKAGRYKPRPRPPKSALSQQPSVSPQKNKSIHEDHYELKLPKVDISNTSYAKLISQFRKDSAKRMNRSNSGTSTPVPPTSAGTANEDRCNTPLSTVSEAGGTPQYGPLTTSGTSSPAAVNTSGTNTPLNSTLNDADKAITLNETESNSYDSVSSSNSVFVPVDYDKMTEDYYKHYYSYYYTYYSSLGDPGAPAYTQEQIVACSSRAASAAATSAVQSAKEKAAALVATQSVTPPDNIRPIIDRMADYVARNGPEFEERIRAKKDDTRFTFLLPTHPYNAYYKKRLGEAERNKARIDALLGGGGREAEPKKIASSASSPALFGPANNKSPESKSTSISFLVKSKGESSSSGGIEERSLSKPAVFNIAEEEDDEDQGNSPSATNHAGSPMDISMTQSDDQFGALEEFVDKEMNASVGSRNGVPQSSSLDASKRTDKDRLQNSLSSAARERLSEVRKEGEVQAERKRKAAAFMAKLREEQRLKEEAQLVESERERIATKQSAQDVLAEKYFKREKSPPPPSHSRSHSKHHKSRSRSPKSHRRSSKK